MKKIKSKLLNNRDVDDSGALIDQLEREISCLQRQLDRLHLLDGQLDTQTLDTYQDMIASRRDMLSELNTSRLRLW